MTKEARNHHYVPQAYLRAFTDGGSKKSKFTVYDVTTGDRFETVPRNVCAVRDFNRVDVPGVPADFVESEMSKFESKIVPAVNQIEATNELSNDSWSCILNLIALLATRHPDRRESTRKFHEQIAKRTMDLVMSRRQSYEKVLSELKAVGQKATQEISYDQMRTFLDKGEYEIQVTTEHHLYLEEKMLETALKLLAERKWMLYRAMPDDGHFITSDHPVVLTHRHPEKLPLFYRNSPGFGLRDTEVVFPLSQHLALVGTFDGENGYERAHPRLIAGINTRTMMYSSRQVYSPKRSFTVIANEAIGSGPDLLRQHTK